jgi:hypothetical protein
MDDFTLAIGTEKKPGGRFVTVFQEPADDEERIAFDAETIKIDVPEKWAKGIGQPFFFFPYWFASARRGDFLLR